MTATSWTMCPEFSLSLSLSPLDACSCGPRAGVCWERLELNMRVGYLRGGLRTFGLLARTHEKQRKGSIQRSASVRGVWSNARAGVNVNRVNVNGRSYVGSDSPRAAASALGSSYSIPLHGVSRNGMCICMYVYVCMYVCMNVCMAPVSRARSAAVGQVRARKGLGCAGERACHGAAVR